MRASIHRNPTRVHVVHVHGTLEYLENDESRRGVAVDRMSDEYITVAVDTVVCVSLHDLCWTHLEREAS